MRKTLTFVTLSLVLLGLFLASIPFIKSMQPNERVFNNLPRIDLSGIDPSEYLLLKEHVLNGYNGFYKVEWGVLIIRRQSGEYDIWDIPYLDGGIGLPHINWWQIYENCKNFGPTLSNGKVLENGSIACHDEEMSEWGKREWRWSFSGENLGEWTQDLQKTKGTIERGDFVFSKGS